MTRLRGRTQGIGIVLAVLALAGCGDQASAPSVVPSPAIVAPSAASASSGPEVLISPAPIVASSGAPTLGGSATATGRLTGEPDPKLTPGAFNPDVTQATIRQTICVSGWTATIRPSCAYTTALKRRQIVEYGYVQTSPRYTKRITSSAWNWVERRATPATSGRSAGRWRWPTARRSAPG
jgi:hypothetical protein